jgi:hypothetical protein
MVQPLLRLPRLSTQKTGAIGIGRPTGLHYVVRPDGTSWSQAECKCCYTVQQMCRLPVQSAKNDQGTPSDGHLCQRR